VLVKHYIKLLKHADKSYCRHISMLVTSQLAIQTTKMFYIFFISICAPPLWQRLLHPCLQH